MDWILAPCLRVGGNEGYGHSCLAALSLFLSAPKDQQAESPSRKAGQHALVVEAFKDPSQHALQLRHELCTKVASHKGWPADWKAGLPKEQGNLWTMS